MKLSRLAYDRTGTGEPLVLLHGIGHRRQAWDPIVAQLAEHFEVFTVDMAGFGESPAYPKGVAYDMRTACENLTENFAEWGIERPHVVGNSLGGAVALELAARGQAASVTALSPAGFFGPIHRIRAFVILIALRSASLLPDAVLKYTAKTPAGRHLVGSFLYAHPGRLSAEQTYGDSVALKHATGFERTLRAGITYVFKSPIAVPTTIAWGTRDHILPFAQSALARERLPEATHVGLPHCGHVPMSDAPELIVRIIGENCAAATARATAEASGRLERSA